MAGAMNPAFKAQVTLGRKPRRLRGELGSARLQFSNLLLVHEVMETQKRLKVIR